MYEKIINYNLYKMKNVKFLNWLLVLFVVFTNFNFASCSDDDNSGGGNSSKLPGDAEPNLAGDDFYAYVNGAWHAGLEDSWRPNSI